METHANKRLVLILFLALSGLVSADSRDVYDTGPTVLWANYGITSTGGSVSSPVSVSYTTQHTLQYNFNTTPTFRIRAMCSLDGTDYYYPATAGSDFTVTTTSGFITFSLPYCRVVKLHALADGTGITRSITGTWGAQ